MKEYLEPNEVEMMEAVARYLRDKLLVRVPFRLGCRISEALGIGVDDIDFNQHTIKIEHLKLRINLSCPHCEARLGKSHIFCPKCGARIEEAVAKQQEHKRMRTLPIDEKTLDMLKDYIARGGAVSRNGRLLIFGIQRQRAWQIISELAIKAKLPRLTNPETGRVHKVSPHKLRDAFGTMAMKFDGSGDGLRILQEHLGHASFNTTAKYRKVAGVEQKNWYEKMWAKK